LLRPHVPRAVLVCFSAWVALWLMVVAVASVPAVSPPWTGTAATPPLFRLIDFWWPWLVAAFLAGSVVLAWPLTWQWQHRRVTAVRHVVTVHRALLWLLAAAAALRFALVMRGGQYFDWDEVRYGGSATWMFAYVSTGHFRSALDMMLRSPDHPGFRIIGLILAFFHVATAWPTGLPITEMRYPTGEWFPAYLLSLSSVASIAAVYALALRAGASRREAFLAAFLMFASCSMLMYAQHFYPYDASMALLLFALWLGLARNDRASRSAAVGVLCGLAVLTYEGYWLMACAAGTMHVLRKPMTPVTLMARSVFSSLGALALPALLILAGHLTGRPFLTALARFSRTVYQGDFSEGWSLPWEFLWNVDHGLVIVYMVGVLALVAHVVRHGHWINGALWLSAAVGIYLGLTLGSNVFRRFVVYDRLARQMVPFICLAAASGLARVRHGRLLDRRPAFLFCSGVLLLFVANGVPLWTQRYPRDVARDVVRQYGTANVRLGTTLMHSDNATVPIFLPLEPARASTSAPARYVLLNAKDIWLLDGARDVTAQPAGRVLFSIRHPRQLRSMQFHGYSPDERAFLRSLDLSIKLIDTIEGQSR
jgi:hypothetical protein